MIQDKGKKEMGFAGAGTDIGEYISSNNKTLLRRAILSLTNVYASGISGFMVKIVTFLNLLTKIRDSILRLDNSLLIKWSFSDCRVKVRFFNIVYDFNCAKDHDFNIYMNPYLHEYDVATLIYSILRIGDNFVDVGAHGGLYSLLAGRRVGPEGKVISVEPNPENVKFLEMNVKNNMLRNVIVVPRATGESHKEITLFYSSSHSAFTSAFGNGDKSFKTRMTTLDDIYSRYLEPNNVKLMKIDTEGYDLRVLKGATQMLPETRYVIVEQHSVEMNQFLAKHGFKVMQLKPSQYLFGVNSSLTSRLH